MVHHQDAGVSLHTTEKKKAPGGSDSRARSVARSYTRETVYFDRRAEEERKCRLRTKP